MADYPTVEVDHRSVHCRWWRMAATGCAVEAAYWAKKNSGKVTAVDKAAFTRSVPWPWAFRPSNQYVGISEGQHL